MTTRFKISLAAGVMAAALGTAAFATVAAQDAAQGPRLREGYGGQARRMGPMAGGPMRGPGLGLPFRGLDLSDEQREQLRKIREAHQAEFKQAADKVQAAHEGMRALIEADRIDESAIRAKSADLAAAQAEVAILNAKIRQESLQILTSEQQQKLKELRDTRPGPGPMKRRGPRGQ